jgi:hypothetical protein
MNGISPWATAASLTFAEKELPAVYNRQLHNFNFDVHLTMDACCHRKRGKDPLKGKPAKDGHMEYRLPGNAEIKIDWADHKNE